MKRSSHHAIRITASSKCAMVVLLMLMLVGGSAMTPGAEAQAGAPDEATSPYLSPVVQVTTDPSVDTSPALVQTADGKLLTVFMRDGNLWSRASTDGGATWEAETQIDGCCRHNQVLARADDGTLWLAYDLSRVVEVTPPGYVIEKREIWYRTSTDGGVSWAAERQLPTDSNRDYNPIMFQATDHKLWIVWQSDRTGNRAIWYKTSADGGATWSADAQLTAEGYAPTATATSGGRVVAVYQRGDGELWQRSSGDGGVTWSAEKRIAGCCRTNPSLAAGGGVLWLAYEQEGDIWYRTSANQGTTWSVEAGFTLFAGPDGSVTLTALVADKLGLVWHSIRSSNWDIWFGILGELEDINPPPYVERIEHRPSCNADSHTPITFSALALDETGVASVSLVWTLNGAAQTDLQMFDDGAQGDDVAGDDVWGVQHPALPAGSQVTYTARATDTDGNTYLYPRQNSFTVVPPLVKTADILFVPDAGGSATSEFQTYYTKALDALGYKYDTWDTGLRCAPDSAILNQYTAGRVIWATPYYGYITRDSNVRTAVQSYLDAGGKLFITGQEVALATQGTSFLHDYLHASYVRDDSGLRTVTGIAGSPIGDGLTFGIAGGDGANNQSYPDEVDPIAPAQADFTYQAGALAVQAGPMQVEDETTAAPPDSKRELAPDMRDTLQQPDAPAKPTDDAPSALAGCISSCTAGLHVDTGTYKVVYFAFGFEAINSAADRAGTMERVLAWLAGRPPRPIQRTPAYGQSVPDGAVNFTWLNVPGAASYELQIDTVCTFDSPDLIDQVVSSSSTSYTHSFATLGARCWRVRALPGGDWAAAWPFSISAGVVQVTTDPADDTAPALVQTVDGKLLIVFVRNGNLWSRASTDGGATWVAETQVAGCCRYRPSLARATNGVLWLAYDRDGDIWYRTSADNGATWAAERQLTRDGSGDYDPVVFRAADGKMWIVWQSYRADYSSIWYKTTTDGGVTWSADTKLTTNYENYTPAATAASDGRLIVMWHRYDGLWQRSSSDGGATWSDERQITDWSGYNPGLAAVGGDLWLVYERDGDIWYRTSADGGDTWPDELQFTFFRGSDNAPAAAALASGSAGIAWQSERSGNPDIWFGSPGEREDLNPPPHVAWIEHRPAPNPDSDDPITFRARVMDETGVASVHLMWTLDGVAQADVPMFDDGTHGDQNPGDGVWSVQRAPLAEGDPVIYRVRATDANGNSYRYPGQNSFKVQPPFVKTAAILFVPDAGSNNTPSDTTWFRSYYTNALDALGYRYDTWDTALRGEPGSAILNQYTSGAVIWAVPYRGYVTDYGSDSIGVLQAYLDAGGKLFITGQNIASSFCYSGSGIGFLNDYLHATCRQEDTGLYALAGAAGDPIGDGLALNISGGDGANNQYSKDEVDPIAPAEVILTYRAGVSAMLAEPIRPAEEAPVGPQYTGPGAAPQPDVSTMPGASVAAAPEGNIGSGTAGLHVDTGKYKVVYFAFGFEAINSATDRQVVMERVLNWLKVNPPVKLYLPLISQVASDVTPEPTKAPEPTAAPAPTAMPEPTKAPEPTAAPVPTAVPEPTKAPEPTAVPEPTSVLFLVRYDFEGDFLTSGTVVDRSGNRHDAQVNGAVAKATGISGGQGIAFNGGGYIQAAGNPAAGKTDVTFSLWFKTSNPGENYKLASGARWNWGPGSGWIMATHGPEFWSDDGNSLLLPGQPNNENNFSSGEWIHEVVTYDGSRIKEYTNGQLINDWATTGAEIGQGNPLAVGAWPTFTGYNFLGSMDEFAIYGRGLTQQEVRALYEQGR